MGSGAFAGDIALTNVLIPRGAQEVGAAAFSGCTALSSVAFQGKPSAIGDMAFSGCAELRLDSLPDTVTEVGAGAFAGCSGMSLHELPSRLSSAGSGAFAGCTAMTVASLPGTMAVISSAAFSGCTSMPLAELESSVVEIAGSAFMSCLAMTVSTIPENVSSLGDAAFAGCLGLTSVTFEGIPAAMSGSLFDSCDNLTDIYVPWQYGEVANAPWGADNAFVHYTANGPLCITAADDDGCTVVLEMHGAPFPLSEMQYSLNGGEWLGYDVKEAGADDAQVFTLAKGESVRFAGNNTSFSRSTSNYYSFRIVGRAYAYGSIVSLFDKSCTATGFPVPEGASSPSDYFFARLFADNTGLLNTPQMPVTSLANRCYYETYRGCTGLLRSEDLPSQHLVTYCYQNMYYGCLSLVHPPVIHATDTGGSGACNRMFYGCLSLVRAPELRFAHATANMLIETFANCSSLSAITVALTEWGADTTTRWLSGVAPSGVFTCPEDLPDIRGVSYIPEGWTVMHDEPAPEPEQDEP
jgi:hypothetical protein